MKPFRYLSVCSGIEAASVAWKPLGWECAGVSEIEAFPRAVLQERMGAVPVDWDHRWQAGQNITPLFGDFTQIEAHHVGSVDLLVGGTPCQSFSIAGKRLGLDDPRGNLAIEFLALARRIGARWLVWENVPGVRSSWSGEPEDEAIAEWEESHDFAAFLGLFRDSGYRGGWRTLDAQFTRVAGYERAVPQRRERVFVVGYLGSASPAAAVLFDRESLRGGAAPRRETGQRVAPTISARPTGGVGLGTDFDCDGGLICADVAPTLNAHFGDKMGLEDQHINGGAGMFVAIPFDTTQITSPANGSNPRPGDPAPTLAKGVHAPCIAFSSKDYGNDASAEVAPTLRSMGHDGSHANGGGQMAVAHTLRATGFDASEDGTGRGTPLIPSAIRKPRDNLEQWGVRRLTPTECERLQGFPDGWTRIGWRNKPADLCPDGPRYKALGNSMAVNVMRWLGERIALVDAMVEQ